MQNHEYSVAFLVFFVNTNHPITPALVAPWDKSIKKAKSEDKPQVVLEVMNHGAIGLTLPAQLVNDGLGMNLTRMPACGS